MAYEQVYVIAHELKNRLEHPLIPGSNNLAVDKGIIEQAAEALRHASRAPEPPPPDNTVRDIMAQEAARAMRSDRERAIAKGDINDDDAFIRDLHAVNSPPYTKIAKLISLTARFAGELQHNLIHPGLRFTWKNRELHQEEGTDVIKRVGPNWAEIVDPGLVGNARITCKDIADAHFRLRYLTVDMILACDDYSILDFFCAAVAARWRANSVFAAGPYKTGNEQQAVLHALREAVALFRDYKVEHGNLTLSARQPPTSLRELRGFDGPFLRD